MPRRNRVTPVGDLIAVPDRGLVHGNRGCLHDGAGRITRAFAGRRWISCRLGFRGWRRSPLMQPGRYTELFFLDEATAFAAGHRPCALCRREDYRVFVDRWDALHGERGAEAIDARLHRERLDGRARRFHEAPFGTLPTGTMVLRDGDPFLVAGELLCRWTPGGYVDPLPTPRSGRATVLTPVSTVAMLRGGWEPVVPFLHPSATA